MERRDFLKGVPLLASSPLLTAFNAEDSARKTKGNDRDYWVQTLTRITTPVLQSLSTESLKKKMPVEAQSGQKEGRNKVSHLEAFGRSLAGIAPWLELGPDSSEEGRLRKQFIELSRSSIENAVTPSSPDYMNFTEGGQPLVDAAFFAHALVRAPKQLWHSLDSGVQDKIVVAFKSTRVIKPYQSNWLLFPAMIEAALLKFGKEYDAERINYALNQHEQWYLGDSMYGDGPQFHFDYYNSYVIQPMLLDILQVVHEANGEMKDAFEKVRGRSKRYAVIQERLIASDGSFPPIGRSLAYRCGAFQLLAQVALQSRLPEALNPGQVRSALTAVIRKTIDAEGTFDSNGWLQIGLCGHQPEIGEHYISTGSLYLCTVAFLPLGLDPSNEFWTAPAMDWTSKKVFQGQRIPIDKAL